MRQTKLLLVLLLAALWLTAGLAAPPAGAVPGEDGPGAQIKIVEDDVTASPVTEVVEQAFPGTDGAADNQQRLPVNPEAPGTNLQPEGYFAKCSISCADKIKVFTDAKIYVTTTSLPGGVWSFEIVELDGEYGIIPVSPEPDYKTSKGVRYNWTSVPGQSKTVCIKVRFRHVGDYKLHVWGGAGAAAHDDETKIISVIR